MSKYILGIDPGKTTGVVFFHLKDPHKSISYELPSEGRKSAVAVHDEFWDLLTSSQVAAVICEDWEDRRSNKFTTDPLLAAGPIGVLMAACHEGGIPFVLQRPFIRNRIKDDVLKRSGLWWPHGGGHARQAMKHVLSYQLKRGDETVQNLLYPRPDKGE